MMIVNISVPMLGTSYDFQIDENIQMYQVLEDVISLVCSREQCRTMADRNRVLLWEVSGGRIINRNLSAYENGLRTGSRLILA